MYGVPGLLPTSGENFMLIAPLEIFLLRKMVTRSILILPAVCTHKQTDFFALAFQEYFHVCVYIYSG